MLCLLVPGKGICMNAPLLDVRDLTVTFSGGMGRKVRAVAGVGFFIEEGETLGLVGESGCGKSSTARAVIQLPRPDGGQVFFMGRDLTAMKEKQLRLLRPGFQMVFQDSAAALNPRKSVGESISAPLAVMGVGNRRERARRAMDMMESVGLSAGLHKLRPHAFSGGQRQRIQIARALISRPRLLVCDEPVSSLDVSIQAQILNLLEDLRQKHGLSMLFISHDLAVVKNVSDRIAVMYLGKLCEVAPSEELLEKPLHPYTRALLRAIPGRGPSLNARPPLHLRGDVPSPDDPPTGCRFHTRCPGMKRLCAEQEPPVTFPEQRRQVACHYPLSKEQPFAQCGHSGLFRFS